MEDLMTLAIWQNFGDFLHNYVKYWHKRAKITWNAKGDALTRYFFNCAKTKASHKMIRGLVMDRVHIYLQILISKSLLCHTFEGGLI